MDTTESLAVFGGLLLTGLASSLHCVGMCGPILTGFSQAFERVALTVRGRERSGRWRFDLAWYHAGRIWTYGMLGFGAGLLGQAVRDGSRWLGWQRGAAVVLGGLVVFSGVALLGVVPRLRLESFLPGCGGGRWQAVSWWRSLVAADGWIARLLLGAVMGLLPCGLVYAVLAVVAGLPSPWHSAAGMIAFGVGTLPSLTAWLWIGRFLPGSWRRGGATITALMVILAGVWMLGRAVWSHDHHHHHHGAACLPVHHTPMVSSD